jgi:S-adenosylmethionine hydrolase
VFLSDFGLDDEFVGICHGVMATLAPQTRVIDLTHGIPPGDVRRGAMVLSAALRYVPAGSVLLAVVDPGVGTARRAVAVRDGSGRLSVGPDNGVLSLAWSGGVAEAREIVGAPPMGDPSATFHGRDVFAPAAARLAAGAAPGDLGPELTAASLRAIPWPEPVIDGGEARCEVLAVDRFGNAQLSIRSTDLPGLGLTPGARVVLGVRGREAVVDHVTTFGQVPAGALCVLVDSTGWLAVARNGESAAAELGLGPGDPVRVRMAAGPPPSSGVG